MSEKSVQGLPDVSQHNEATKISSTGSFLSSENIALVACVANALDDTSSKRYHDLKSKRVKVIPSTDGAVKFALKKFKLFIEDKIKNLNSEEKGKMHAELKGAYLEIVASLRRGVEFNGNVGLDDVLEKCNKCFCENILSNSCSATSKTDDKPKSYLSDVAANNKLQRSAGF